MAFRKARRFNALRKRQHPVLGRLRKLFFFTLLVFAFYAVFTTCIADSFKVESVSMTPGFESGDRLVLLPFWYGPRIPFTGKSLPGIFSPRRGDVVVLSPPYAGEPPLFEKLLRPLGEFFTGRTRNISLADRSEWENTRVLRRIIALPGDAVRIRNGEAYVRPQGTPDFVSEFSLSLSAYEITREVLPADWMEDSPLGALDNEIVLGEEEYYVLADNRGGSLDSRLWGPVREDRILTRALLRYWPLGSR
ncbi:MAG: signal peptidase I [Spirochaetaceae bacterium]|nr:signal peptidase I [Spirochaetaceae bacterium]